MPDLPTLRAVSFQAGGSLEEIDDYLLAPTGQECPYCHRQHLQKWEALNGRCRDCLVKYGEAAGWPPACRCEGVMRCVDGVHMTMDHRVRTRCTGRGGLAIDICRGWLAWWARQGGKAKRQEARERGRGGIDVGDL